MPTQYIHRLTFVIPASLQASVNAWITATIDPTGGNWFTNGLSATGSGPATYSWVNAALTDSQCLTIVEKICTLSGVTPPSTWSSMTQAQKIACVASEASAFQSAEGIYVLLDNNLGAWTPQATVLAALGLQVIQSGS